MYETDDSFLILIFSKVRDVRLLVVCIQNQRGIDIVRLFGVRGETG